MSRENDDQEILRKREVYHEVGHALASLAFGHRFRFVTISAGEREDDGAVHGLVRGRARDLAVVLLVGRFASADLSGRDPWNDRGLSDDDRADLAAAGRFVDNRVTFLTRTYDEAAYREKIWEDTLGLCPAACGTEPRRYLRYCRSPPCPGNPVI